MTPHDELDQVSSYIDGELEEEARARFEAHLPSCSECRTTLDALKATVADLRTLPEPAPTEQDSWALRSAIARARRPSKRWQRFALAAGTAAAAVIAIVAITHNGTGSIKNFDASARAPSPGAEFAGANVPVYSLTENFNPQSAQAHLLDVAGVVPGAQIPAAVPGPAGGKTPIPKAQTLASGRAYEFSSVARDRAPIADLNRCAAVVNASAQELVTPIRYELVTFESKPAYFLFFSTADRTELWVVTRARCDVLYFAQTR